MKRAIGLIIAFVLCLSMVTVADPVEIDLSSMTLDELVALRNDISFEISSRVSDQGEPFYPGRYDVGKDIKAGTYVITNVTDDPDNNALNWIECGTATIKENGELESSYHEYIKCGSSVMVSLADGMVFLLSTDTGIMTITTMEKPSWAP